MAGRDDHALLRGWIALTRRALATHPEYRDDAAAHALHRRRLTATLCRARVSGALHALWRGETLRAVVASHPEHDAWFGMPRQTIAVARDPGDAAAIDWIVERVGRCGISADADIILTASDRPLVDPLLAAHPALGIELLLLIGRTREALAALVAERDPPPLAALGLTAGPVRSVAEVEALVMLTRTLFAEHPEWVWFVTGERYLARKMTALMLNLQGGDAGERSQVIRRDGEAVGVLRVTVGDDPRWGRRATLGILLHPRLWGRGVATALYRHGLERLVADGIEGFHGGTNRGPIMHLGRLMKRRLLGVHLRAGAPLPREHFDGYLGPAG